MYLCALFTRSTMFYKWISYSLVAFDARTNSLNQANGISQAVIYQEMR